MTEIQKLKQKLGFFIKKIIEEKSLTLNQTEIAKIINVTQPKVSHLLKMQLQDFGVERLFNIINLFGYDIEIKIEPSKQEEGVIQCFMGMG